VPEIINGATEDVFKAMESLERMHKAKVCLIIGEEIPEIFVNASQDDIQKFEMDLEYDSETGDPGTQGGETMGRIGIFRAIHQMENFLRILKGCLLWENHNILKMLVRLPAFVLSYIEKRLRVTQMLALACYYTVTVFTL